MILQKKVKEISKTPVDFIAKVWDYILSVVISVFTNHCDSYPILQASTIRAARNLIEKMKQQSFDHVMEIVEMEKLADYTCSPEYMSEWGKLMAQQEVFMKVMNDTTMPSRILIEGFGWIEVGHLRGYPSVREQAFDMKMRITAYWKVVLRRLVDSMALHLLLSVQNLVNRDMEIEVVNEFMGPHGGGIEKILDESPAVAKKRERLSKSIKLLKDSKDAVAEIMDRITVED
ncbi:hypothetical protein RHMOL_Rhmol07G0129600 [Rhododendron molle]|uniref:Uncharacterized protein n=1 Tax=Rhododendron molle TaxID=49168 RepID=A0ACC0N216_RHOML|nr:hypothetical protein RHMOL_Rhmol07G0129600 [Rhododendron molle]